MKQIYMRVMIDEPNTPAYTKAFKADNVEQCIDQVHEYLETTTELGTRCSIVFCGYEHGEVYETT